MKQRRNANDNDKKNKEEAPIKEKLVKELDALRAASEKGADALLTHVYKEHPPKNETHTRVQEVVENGGTTAEDNHDDDAHTVPVALKTQCKKALIHYHEKYSTGHGIEWKVLSAEVYKYVAAIYEGYK